jgi:hypothetical protein
VLYAFQRSLIYYPQPRSVGTAETILKLPVADADVLVSVRPQATTRSPRAPGILK